MSFAHVIVLAVLLAGFAMSLTAHEFAHAWTAYLLGDGFAKRQGRVSLNPFRHLSLLGTLAMFVLHFGWAKPVPVNLYNFKRPRLYYFLTSLAGPAANLLLAGACWGAMHLTRRCYAVDAPWGSLLEAVHPLLFLMLLINVILAALNLLPLPPLDGSKIWPVLFRSVRPTFSGKATWISVGLLVALLWTDSLDPVFNRIRTAVHAIAPESDADVYERHYMAGLVASSDGDLELADRQLTVALALHPRSRDAWAMRACVRSDRQDHAGALADIDQAIALDPSDPEFHDHRAIYLEWLSRPDDANTARALATALRGPAEGPDAADAPDEQEREDTERP